LSSTRGAIGQALKEFAGALYLLSGPDSGADDRRDGVFFAVLIFWQMGLSPRPPDQLSEQRRHGEAKRDPSGGLGGGDRDDEHGNREEQKGGK